MTRGEQEGVRMISSSSESDRVRSIILAVGVDLSGSPAWCGVVGVGADETERAPRSFA